MFINKAPDGRNNLSGIHIQQKRKALGLSQRMLADKMQLLGLDMDKNAIQRIESGQRFVTDIELNYFARFFHTSTDALLGTPRSSASPSE